MFDLVIAGGRVHLETGAERCDIAVTGETIAEVAERITAPARRRVEAEGLEVLPGLIDPHVHLGLPAGGAVSSDDVTSGTRAALFGGVTTVIDFSLQRPGMGMAEAVEARQAEFRGRSYCDYALHANVTDFPDDFEARLRSELTRLVDLGVTSLKIFTTYSRRGMMIPETAIPTVLGAAAARGILVLVHAEEDAIVNAATDRLAAEGRLAVADFPHNRPAEAEAEAIGRVTAAAVSSGARLYVVHVSTKAGLARATGAPSAAASAARGTNATGAGGARVFVETCPQYLWLTEEKYRGQDGHRFIVTPPLRTASDREALRSAVRDARVDVIATDHCPFRSSETDHPERSCAELPSGLPGIETRLPLLYTLAVNDGWADTGRWVDLLSTNPARIFGLYPRKGVIRAGADADLVLFDAKERWTIEPARLHMRVDHSPYSGQEVQGRVRAVVRRGAIVLENGKVSAPPEGCFLRRSPERPGGDQPSSATH